ncbi:MAG: MoaD/ThiS family protein [Candidatus Bipolaricaulota bacterium]
MVSFKILGSASEAVGETELEIEVNEDKPIREILPGEPLKDELYIVLVNGESADLDTPVSGDAKVVILPWTSGG